MARPRKPTQLLKLAGTFDSDQRKNRIDEPQDLDELGLPPEHLSESQTAAWNEIVSSCCLGVLKKSDSISLEIAAVLLAELRDNPARIQSSKISSLGNILSKFGMTPADRSRVTVQQPKKENPFKNNGRRFDNE